MGCGTKLDLVMFWKPYQKMGKKPDSSCLGQWWMQDFVVDGVKYNCAEQYMMAQKAIMFNEDGINDRVLDLIMKETNPAEMKKYGRRVQNFDSGVWDEKCTEVVKKGNIAKFSQNEDIKEYLISTGEAILVEASPYDTIWGIGMGSDDPNSRLITKWKGKNYLGFVLMEVRDEIRER